MGVKYIFFKFYRKDIGNGKITRFWKICGWVIDLCECFSRLYNLTFTKHILVAAVFDIDWAVRQSLKDLCAHVNLVEKEDICRWLLTNSGCFPVKSMYVALKLDTVEWKHKEVWLTRVPMKIKVFLWLVFHKSILTKDVLIRRGWKDRDSRYCFVMK